ncbi:hypothetical protein [Streptomyces sp. NRRL WC-3549]|uniref:hypothetical protein n=1 Tax=Streptomyces sp. NRRL WC-3549 TaxID=1463925 RepID=UPI00131A9906|nr:hypothetical protein [Streptomyces sp. NRRL WC-3549]
MCGAGGRRGACGGGGSGDGAGAATGPASTASVTAPAGPTEAEEPYTPHTVVRGGPVALARRGETPDTEGLHGVPRGAGAAQGEKILAARI